MEWMDGGSARPWGDRVVTVCEGCGRPAGRRERFCAACGRALVAEVEGESPHGWDVHTLDDEPEPATPEQLSESERMTRLFSPPDAHTRRATSAPPDPPAHRIAPVHGGRGWRVRLSPAEIARADQPAAPAARHTGSPLAAVGRLTGLIPRLTRILILLLLIAVLVEVAVLIRQSNG